MSGPPAPSLSPRLVWTTAVVLLTLFASACLYVARHTSPTFDEPDQLATGYYALTTGRHTYTNIDLRFTQMWEALPLLALQPRPHFPTIQDQQQAPGINFGRLFMFDPRNNTEAMVFWSRAMVTLLAVGLGVVLFLWSRRLWGPGGGLVTLACYCLNPLVIAHSAVATTDIPTTLFYTLAVGALWRLMHRVSAGNLLLAGLAAGVLGASKISGLLLLPVAVVMLVWRMAGKQPLEVKLPGKREVSTRAPSWLLLAGALVGAVLVAYVIVWAVYGFRYPIAEVAQTSSWDTNPKLQLGFAAPVIQFCRTWRLLPEAYLYDLHLFTTSGSLRRAFLMGEYSLNGWWYFFPVAFVVKTPLPFLLLLAGAAAATWSYRRELAAKLAGLAPLLVLSVIYGLTAVAGNLNIGARHLLPLHPLLFVFAGVLACIPVASDRVRGIWIGALLAWSAVEVGAVHPNYLAYFNELAGGPAEGHRYLVDSSYEWGEELPAVQRWLADRAKRPGPKPPVYLAYFGCADLTHYGIKPVANVGDSPGDGGNVIQLPSFYDQRPVQPYDLVPGTYLISVTMQKSLYGMMTLGPWRPTCEQAYQSTSKDMLRLMAAMTSRTALDAFFEKEGGAAAPTDTPAQARELGAQIWTRTIRLHDELRFSRLCAYLRLREPEERIGYGIMVYELSATELDKALKGPPAELRQNYVVKGTENYTQDQLDFVK
jgi:hypothetical protein